MASALLRPLLYYSCLLAAGDGSSGDDEGWVFSLVLETTQQIIIKTAIKGIGMMMVVVGIVIMLLMMWSPLTVAINLEYNRLIGLLVFVVMDWQVEMSCTCYFDC